MKMNKFFSICAVVIVTASIGAGCGDGGPIIQKPPPELTPRPPPVIEPPPRVVLGSLNDIRPAAVDELCGTVFEVNATYGAVSDLGRTAQPAEFADKIKEIKSIETLRGFNGECIKKFSVCHEKERGLVKLSLLNCAEMANQRTMKGCTTAILPQVSENCSNSFKTLSSLFF